MAATRRRAALKNSLAKFEEKFAALGKGRVASIIGRYYAMDRDNRWDRVEQAYDLMTLAKGEFQADTRRCRSAGRLRSR
ncbi:2,3-bisphosphoglycerate-independent phosphoglycerate mutase [Raoultella ornithinolytica]|nr:2,3-bisphosphoglycerate-independent phosphoglycerate mutase [Raoultella ornithinolytica]